MYCEIALNEFFSVRCILHKMYMVMILFICANQSFSLMRLHSAPDKIPQVFYSVSQDVTQTTKHVRNNMEVWLIEVWV